MTEQALRECPFCGGEGGILATYGNFYVQCKKCSSGMKLTLNKCSMEEAIAAWNTRAYDAELEELRLIKQKYEYTREYLEALLRFGYTILFEPRGQIYRDVDLSSLLSKMKGVLNLKYFAPIAQLVEPA